MSESQSLKTIDEIFEENDRVILDNYIGSRELSSWYQDYLYYQHSYAELDLNLLSDFLTESQRVASFYSRDKAIIPEKVAEESAVFASILSAKLVYLNRDFERRKYKQKRDYDEFLSEDFETAKEILEAIAFAHQDRYRICKKRFFKPSDLKAFNNRFEFIKQVARQFGSKFSYRELQGYEEKPKEDIFTDEQICSVAFEFMIEQKLPVAIITRDSHIAKLMRDVKFRYKRLFGENSAFYKNLEKNPAKVYFLFQGENAELVYSTEKNDLYPSRNKPVFTIGSEGAVLLAN